MARIADNDARNFDYDRVDALIREAHRMRSEYAANLVRRGFRRLGQTLSFANRPGQGGLASRGA